jgi:uncharacterized protein YciI
MSSDFLYSNPNDCYIYFKLNTMKKLMFLSFLLSISLMANAQDKKNNPDYDAALAKKHGADDYGMKMYVLVMLKTGSNTSETKAKTDSLFAGHMANMEKLVKEDKLIVAGPLGKNDKNYRGIFILNVKTLDEAKAILTTDPAVKAKLLDADLFNWYGSAALAEYLPASEKVGKYKF